MSTELFVKSRWRGPIFTSAGSDRSCGVAICFKENTVSDIQHVYSDSQGRLIVCKFTLHDITYTLINIYAPNIDTQRKQYFQELSKWCTKNCFVAGDFNVALTATDVSSNNVFKGDVSGTAIYDLIHTHGLIDTWRVAHPYTRGFSRRQKVLSTVKQSRIDLCLASADVVRYISDIKYTFNIWSDHAHLIFNLDKARTPRSGGSWCFNTSLLQDRFYRNKISTFLARVSADIPFVEDVSGWWECIKARIKFISITYSKVLRWKQRQEETALRDTLELHNRDMIPHYPQKIT